MAADQDSQVSTRSQKAQVPPALSAAAGLWERLSESSSAVGAPQLWVVEVMSISSYMLCCPHVVMCVVSDGGHCSSCSATLLLQCCFIASLQTACHLLAVLPP